MLATARGRPCKEDSLANGTPRQRVILHVYDIIWLTRLSESIGRPAFHVSIEVHNHEHSFGSDGIFCDRLITGKEPGAPRKVASKQYIYRESVPLGFTNCTQRDIRRVLANMRNDWPGSSYSIFGKNCQSFAVELCEKMGIVDGIPAKYRSFSEFGNEFSALAGVTNTFVAGRASTVTSPKCNTNVALTPRWHGLCCSPMQAKGDDHCYSVRPIAGEAIHSGVDCGRKDARGGREVVKTV
jgi:hypothetical protein